jgi:hypothetical protein
MSDSAVIRGTRISQAVAKLDAEYRWCLTGTPVTNSLYVAIGSEQRITYSYTTCFTFSADLYGFLR